MASKSSRDRRSSRWIILRTDPTDDLATEGRDTGDEMLTIYAASSGGYHLLNGTEHHDVVKY